MKNLFDIQLFAEEETGEEVMMDAASEESVEEVSVDDEQEEAPDRASEFDELINGDYKDEYHKRMESAIQGRVKNLKARADSQEAILRAVGERYGVDSSNPQALLDAFNADNSYIREQADANGVTEDVQLKLNQLKAINAQREIDNIKAKLSQDLEEVKALFPDFDFEAEMANPEFAEMVQNKVSFKKAYVATHMDEILGGAMQQTAKTVREKTINDIKARGLRPSENGATSHAAATSKIDIDSMTLDDFKKYADMAGRGERVNFDKFS